MLRLLHCFTLLMLFCLLAMCKLCLLQLLSLQSSDLRICAGRICLLLLNERTDNDNKIGSEGGTKSGQKAEGFFCREGCVGAWAGTAIKLR